MDINKEINARLKVWAEMTERNAHGDRLENIAFFFACYAKNPEQFTAIYRVFATLNDEHSRIGYLHEWMYRTREQLRVCLRELIREDFGEEILNRINP